MIYLCLRLYLVFMCSHWGGSQFRYSTPLLSYPATSSAHSVSEESSRPFCTLYSVLCALYSVCVCVCVCVVCVCVCVKERRPNHTKRKRRHTRHSATDTYTSHIVTRLYT